ncbi:MAG: hypothetical protein ACM3SV_07430 [Betaproteobacteria bacterium]
MKPKKAKNCGQNAAAVPPARLSTAARMLGALRRWRPGWPISARLDFKCVP